VRRNRNGIPILDPPHEANKLRRTRCRTPEEHRWGPPVKIDEDWDWIVDEGADQLERVCRRCGERDRYWRQWMGRP
jgi:hypothetical protein